MVASYSLKYGIGNGLLDGREARLLCKRVAKQVSQRVYHPTEVFFDRLEGNCLAPKRRGISLVPKEYSPRPPKATKKPRSSTPCLVEYIPHIMSGWCCEEREMKVIGKALLCGPLSETLPKGKESALISRTRLIYSLGGSPRWRRQSLPKKRYKISGE